MTKERESLQKMIDAFKGEAWRAAQLSKAIAEAEALLAQEPEAPKVREIGAMSNEKSEMLRKTAEEIREEGHPGWGNVCEYGADEIDRLRAQLAEAQKLVELVQAERDEAHRQLAEMQKGESVAWKNRYELYLDSEINQREKARSIPLFLAAPKLPDELTEKITELVDEIDGLVGESSGVYGLHLNGDIAPWDELLRGGRFERLGALEEVRQMLNAAPEPKGDE